MKHTNTAFLILSLLLVVVQSIWIEEWDCRIREKKRRGYRAGFLDIEQMYHSGAQFHAGIGNRGTIEKWEDLPAIEFYENTYWVHRARNVEDRKHYKSDDLEAWDEAFKNVTELSQEMHDFYIMDHHNRYMMTNQSFVIIIGNKDDANTLYFGDLFTKHSCALEKKEITTVFIDPNLDPILAATYDHIQETPSIYFVWNET